MADAQVPKYGEMILAAIVCQGEAGCTSPVGITDIMNSIGLSDDHGLVKLQVLRYFKGEVENLLLLVTNESTGAALKLPQNVSESSKISETSLKAEEPATNPEAAKPNADDPARTATHPEYSEMIAAAIKYLREKRGASFRGIFKYITNVYGLCDNPDFVKRQLMLHLRKGVESGALFMERYSKKIAVRSNQKAAKSQNAPESPPSNPDAAEPNVEEPAEG